MNPMLIEIECDRKEYKIVETYRMNEVAKKSFDDFQDLIAMKEKTTIKDKVTSCSSCSSFSSIDIVSQSAFFDDLLRTTHFVTWLLPLVNQVEHPNRNLFFDLPLETESDRVNNNHFFSSMSHLQAHASVVSQSASAFFLLVI